MPAHYRNKRKVIKVKESSKTNAESSVKNNENVNVSDKMPLLKQWDPDIDNNLPETVTLLTTPDGGKLYLVGTAHYSIESQNDVSKVIQAVQPHMVVVELCKARSGVMQYDEEVLKKKFEFHLDSIMGIIQSEGVYSGMLHILMLRMAAHIAKEVGLTPGGEFRRAFKEAKKIPNCMIHLADRPIDITMQRALRSLSWWQTIKVVRHLLASNVPITKEDVESCKQRAVLEEMVAKMAEEFPVLGEVFVKERDLYLTYSLQVSCLPHRTPNGTVPARVVGIVGLGHTPGIVANWGKVKPSDIAAIIKVPPLSLSSKILRFTVKASFIGATIYVSYKLIRVPGAIASFVKSSSVVQGFLKVSNIK